MSHGMRRNGNKNRQSVITEYQPIRKRVPIGTGLLIALRSCYLQNHLWTTAELTVDSRLSPYARNALHRYVINLSSSVLFPTYTYLWS